MFRAAARRAAARGYLGPLGDDFPSIFPIAMGLLFFFSAITLTYDYYNMKRDTAVLMDANVALAKVARSQIVFDAGYWEDICVSVAKMKANYGVRAKVELDRLNTADNEFEPVVSIPQNSPDFLDNPCVDTVDEDGVTKLPEEGDFFIELTYPVLVKTGASTNMPATLKVTTWK